MQGFWVRVVKYVADRQNEDGGYTFCKGTESNAQDTYYALAILNLLGVQFPNLEKTVEWLQNFTPEGLYQHYYVAKALRICGKEPNKKLLREFILSLPAARGEFSSEVYVEVPSELLSLFMLTELLELAGVVIDRIKTVNWLLSFKNDDGGFGANGHSSLNSTYYAVASLNNLGYPVISLKDTLEYVRACEKPFGGFTAVPEGTKPYMEHVYFGFSTLAFFNQKLRYPKETAEFILRCQNANGGFARSEIGISTFEDTFYAATVLRHLEHDHIYLTSCKAKWK